MTKKLKLETILQSINLVDEFSRKNSDDLNQLTKIGMDAFEGYEADRTSRLEFEIDLANWTKLALQICDKKTFPWPNASNVKYPLLATASMQFAARAYPSLVPSSGDIVKCKVLGFDMDGEKKRRAIRVGKFMSHQIMDEMEEWEEEMDKLLITLPIAGTVFKKTYWDSEKERNVSCVIMPKDLVINYWAKDLDTAERITEVYRLSKRKIEEKVRFKLFSNVELPEPEAKIFNDTSDPYKSVPPSSNDITTPYIICEQHTFLDLDDDGYAEPYIVTFEENSKTVLRIVARFNMEDVKVNEDGDIVKIVPQQFYTKYGFVPNPDGGFYDIGFGRLLGPINESTDTLINQLIDAGSMTNMQAGFIGKGLRIKMGDGAFKPGEWRAVNATGTDLKNSIMPLPMKEPSAVLMQLLTFLVQSGKELASVAEIFVGKMPGQNTPATTTMATIEQGMKVFTAVYKRVFRSMTKEFRKLYRLNAMYLNPQTEVAFLDVPMEQSDFAGPDMDIIPAADPASITQQEKQAKVQAMMQLLPMGVINPMEFAKYYLEAFEIPSAETFLMQPQPPQPDPEQERMQIESELAKESANHKMQLEERKFQLKQTESSNKADLERRISEQKINHEAVSGDLKARNALMGSMMQQQMGQQGHRQRMTQAQETHRQKMFNEQEKKRASPK